MISFYHVVGSSLINYLVEVKEEFFKKLDEKTTWSSHEVKELYKNTLREVYPKYFYMGDVDDRNK